jgi:hypothetical protein
MKKNIVYLSLFLILLQLLLGNVSQKILKFEKSSRIEDVTRTNKYTSAVIIKEKYPYCTTYLYDGKGNQIYEYTLEKSYFMKVTPVDQYDLFIMIIRRGFKDANGKYSKDLIQALDINSHKVVWEASSTAISYNISPDEKYLITANSFDPEGEMGKCPFELIYIKDGSKKSYSFDYLRATFLDNENILLLSMETIENPDFYNQEYFKVKSEKELIMQEKIRLRRNFKEGQLSDQDYKRLNEEITGKLDSIDKKIRDFHIGVTNEGAIFLKNPESNRFKSTSIKAFIYNINNDKIENEKFLYDEKGSEIYFEVEPMLGTINIDSTKNIYIYAYVMDEVNEVILNAALFKFNKDLELKWQKNVDKDESLIKIIHNNKFNFMLKNKQDAYIVNNDDGSDIDLPTFLVRNSDIQSTDLKWDRPFSVIKIYNNVRIDSPNSSIILINDY